MRTYARGLRIKICMSTNLHTKHVVYRSAKLSNNTWINTI